MAGFVQESIRTVASSDDVDFETPANLSIDDLTEKAFYDLGNGGHMKAVLLDAPHIPAGM